MLVSGVWGAMAFGGFGDYRQLQRIWATEPERIEAAIGTYPEAFSDGFILSAFPETLKAGPAEVKDFATQKAFVERFRAKGLPVQICVSSTIGHTDAWTLPADLPLMVGSNGQVAKAMACPRSDALKKSLAERFARYAALKPTVLWLDDDFRMPHHPPVDFACFCPECLAKFAAKTGLKLDRAALVRAILDDACVDGVNVREAFGGFATEALTDLVKVVAEAVHAVDDSVALGFMAVNPSGMAYGERDFKAWRELGRNGKGEVWFRPGSGAYSDADPLGSGGIVAKNLQIARLVAATEGPGVVNVAEEVTCPYDRKTKSMRLTFFECALNVGLAGCDGTSFDAIKPNLAEQLGPGAIVDMLNRRRGELARMRALVAGRRQVGVAVPPLGAKRGPVKSFYELVSRNETALLSTFCAGVPLAFRKGTACQALDAIDRAKLPARVDATARVGLSLWESPDGGERIAFVWNLNAAALVGAKLALDGCACVERMDGTGAWSAVGCAAELTLPAIDGWDVGVLRIRRRSLPVVIEATDCGVDSGVAGCEVGSSSLRLKLNGRGEVVRLVTRGGVELGGRKPTALFRLSADLETVAFAEGARLTLDFGVYTTTLKPLCSEHVAFPKAGEGRRRISREFTMPEGAAHILRVMVNCAGEARGRLGGFKLEIVEPDGSVREARYEGNARYEGFIARWIALCCGKSHALELEPSGIALLPL